MTENSGLKELDWDSMSPIEKYAHVLKVRIHHPRFMKVVNTVRECHLLTNETGLPHCALITGETGVGKSQVFEYYKKEYNGDSNLEGVNASKRILAIEVPRPASQKHMVQALLQEIGDYHYNKGTVYNALDRLQNFIRDCGVEMILLDEFHHFINPTNDKILSDVADWFKTLINYTKVSVVLFGLPYSDKILKSNGQLFRRAPFEERITPFGYKTKEEKVEFRRLLHQYDKLLPFKETSHLSSETLSKRIYEATNGKMYGVSMLLAGATKIAAEEGATSVQQQHFDKAYRKNRYLQEGTKNTFKA